MQPSTTGGLEVVGEFAGQFRAWRWKNVAFFCWSDDTTVEAARELATIFTDLTKSQPSKLSVINVVSTRIGLPGSDIRSALASILQGQANRLACVSLIVEGAGFWISAARSFVTGLLVLVPRAFELRIETNLDELVQGFPEAHRRLTGVELDPVVLREHVDTVMAWAAGPSGAKPTVP